MKQFRVKFKKNAQDLTQKINFSLSKEYIPILFKEMVTLFSNGLNEKFKQILVDPLIEKKKKLRQMLFMNVQKRKIDEKLFSSN